MNCETLLSATQEKRKAPDSHIEGQIRKQGHQDSQLDASPSKEEELQVHGGRENEETLLVLLRRRERARARVNARALHSPVHRHHHPTHAILSKSSIKRPCAEYLQRVSVLAPQVFRYHLSGLRPLDEL